MLAGGSAAVRLKLVALDVGHERIVLCTPKPFTVRAFASHSPEGKDGDDAASMQFELPTSTV
jgi:hypothetical protein